MFSRSLDWYTLKMWLPGSILPEIQFTLKNYYPQTTFLIVNWKQGLIISKYMYHVFVQQCKSGIIVFCVIGCFCCWFLFMFQSSITYFDVWYQFFGENFNYNKHRGKSNNIKLWIQLDMFSHKLHFSWIMKLMWPGTSTKKEGKKNDKIFSKIGRYRISYFNSI